MTSTTLEGTQNATNGQAKRADVYSVHTSDNGRAAGESAPTGAHSQPRPSHQPVNRIVLDPDPPCLHKQVREAFDHVATCGSCLLPQLLEETRRRGIADDDVKRVIQCEERDGIEGEGLHCLRNAAGVGFVATNFGSTGCMASATELFTELATVASCDSEESECSNSSVLESARLSGKLRARGDDLTPAEAAILDTAQTMRAKFVTGQPVPFKALQRVTVRFNADCPMNVDFKAAVVSLVKRGLCERVSGEPTQFRLVQHLGDKNVESESRFSALGITKRQEQLLLCCAHCCSVGFDTRNVAARCAVKWLMMERHNMTKRQAKQVIRELLQAGILESLQGRGSDALRLTPAAVLVVRKECETLSEAKRVLALREGDAKGLTTGDTLAVTADEADSDEAELDAELSGDVRQAIDHMTDAIDIMAEWTDLSASRELDTVTPTDAHNGLQKALQYLSGVLRRKAA